MQQYEAKLADLKKDPAYWDDRKDLACPLAQQQRILAVLASGEEREAVMQTPLHELHDRSTSSRAGIESTLPITLREKWDAETEGTVLGTLAVQGVSAEVARAVHSWYENVFTAHGGDVGSVDPVALEADFRAMAKRAGLAQDLVDALVEYERARLGFK